MARFVITVDFYLHAGTLEPFLRLIKENAHKSLTEEPGCDRFDVLIEKGRPTISCCTKSTRTGRPSIST